MTDAKKLSPKDEQQLQNLLARKYDGIGSRTVTDLISKSKRKRKGGPQKRQQTKTQSLLLYRIKRFQKAGADNIASKTLDWFMKRFGKVSATGTGLLYSYEPGCDDPKEQHAWLFLYKGDPLISAADQEYQIQFYCNAENSDERLKKYLRREIYTLMTREGIKRRQWKSEPLSKSPGYHNPRGS
jgi:hypothetical protein